MHVRPAGGWYRWQDVMVWPSPGPQHIPELWPSADPLALGHLPHDYPESDALSRASKVATSKAGPHKRPATAEGYGSAHIHL